MILMKTEVKIGGSNLFWKNYPVKQKQIFSLTSNCKRHAFRIKPLQQLMLIVDNSSYPIIDISNNGVSIECGKFKQGDKLSGHIDLDEKITIQADFDIVHEKASICGCIFSKIKASDKELIDKMILEQQKIQIRKIVI